MSEIATLPDHMVVGFHYADECSVAIIECKCGTEYRIDLSGVRRGHHYDAIIREACPNSTHDPTLGWRRNRDVALARRTRGGMITAAVLVALEDEVRAGRYKFPGNRDLLAALMEEVGELSTALMEGDTLENIIGEAKQVAAVAIRIMEEGDAAYPGSEVIP